MIFDAIRATEMDTSPFSLAIKSSISGLPIEGDQPVYYSDINEQQQRIFLTEAEVFQKGHTFDINPLIYYRLGAGSH